MQLYKCLVRCGGLLTHEVPKYNIPREEIMLLRHIHGNDAIVRIYKTTVVDDVQHDKVVQDLSKYYDIKYISAAFPGTDLVGLEKGLDHLQDEEMETDIEALLDEKRSEEIPDIPIKENVLSGMESMGGEYRPE